MGRVFLIEFDQTPDNHFYLCRLCQAHVALSQEFHYNFTNNELSGALFGNVINVHTLSPEQDRWVGARTVSDVYCNRCCSLLGIKFIEVANDEGAVRVGYFILHLNKLLLWNGVDIVENE